jgi:hypothetical protein
MHRYFTFYCLIGSFLPYLKDKQITDIYKVFHHSFIKNYVYQLNYRNLLLDTVASGMLGYGKYVSELTGIKITGENVPPNEQKKYVLRDAELVMRLIERNNYKPLFLESQRPSAKAGWLVTVVKTDAIIG